MSSSALHPAFPDLRVTNRGGQITTLAGLGSEVTGTGFFRTAGIQDLPGGQTITQAIFNSRTGETIVVRGDGGLSAFGGTSFTSLFFPEAGRGVSTLDAAAGFLVAGFEDGSVGLLSEASKLLFRDEPDFDDQLSA